MSWLCQFLMASNSTRTNGSGNEFFHCLCRLPAKPAPSSNCRENSLPTVRTADSARNPTGTAWSPFIAGRDLLVSCGGPWDSTSSANVDAANASQDMLAEKAKNESLSLINGCITSMLSKTVPCNGSNNSGTTVQSRIAKTVLTCFDFLADLLEARLRTKVSSARLRLATYARPLPKSHPSLL